MKEAGGEIAHEIMTGGGEIAGGGGREWRSGSRHRTGVGRGCT